MARKQSFSDKFWNDKHGRFVVWQRPNALLWIWIIATAISIIMSANLLERILTSLGEIAIFIWALLELSRGVNYFRRMLGLGVLLLLAASFLL